MADAPREWFRFVTNKATPKAAEIYIYGDIGTTFWGDGVDAQAFIDQLDELGDVKDISVRINSPGGSAWDGLAIANAMIRNPATITTYIDGLAASAASVVAVAGDRVVSSKYAQGMLHNAHAIAAGTAKDFRDIASQLDGLNSTMAQYYADRAGGTPADWQRAMSKETWYNADEMLDAGLVHEIDTSAVREEVERAAASAMASTAEVFRYRGRMAAPAPDMRASNPTKEGLMADKKSIAESLGLDPNASDDDILAATRKALGVEDEDKTDDKTDDTDAGSPATEAETATDVEAPPVPDVSKAAATAAAGTVTLDAATYADLKQQAAMGAAAHKTLTAQAHARTIDGAIDQGKIPLARREHYMSLMSADPNGTTDLLKTLAPGTAVPLQEIGHSADTTPSASVTEDPKFKAWKVGV